jgi:hypothetical protein
VDIDIDIAVGGNSFLVQQRRIRAHRGLRVEHGGHHFVLHLEQPAGRLGRRLCFRDNRSNSLPHEADYVVEHVGVIGIDEVILMGRGAVEAAWHFFPSKDFDDARRGSCSLTLNAKNPRMRMRRP